jgi:predicted glycosyltransferase
VKIWFDADNGPHELIIKPLIQELECRVNAVLVTARDRDLPPEMVPHVKRVQRQMVRSAFLDHVES